MLLNIYLCLINITVIGAHAINSNVIQSQPIITHHGGICANDINIQNNLHAEAQVSFVNGLCLSFNYDFFLSLLAC